MYERVTNDGWRVTKLRHGFLWEATAPPAPQIKNAKLKMKNGERQGNRPKVTGDM